MISAEEPGNIISRLAIADEAILQNLLKAANKAEYGLLPDDAGKLCRWAKLEQVEQARQVSLVRMH